VKAGIMKWLTSLGLGVATAIVTYLQSHLGSGPAVDPLLAGLIVAVMSKIINWLGGKIPITEQ